MSAARTCKWRECRRQLITQRADADFCGPDCKNAWHNEERRKRGTTDKRFKGLEGAGKHPLADARALQETSELKSHWSQVIYQGIVSRLEHGPVHADDLEPLFPANDEERSMCRKLVGAQFGSLASRRYIHEVDRRKSSAPSRKGAKSGVFEFTRKGREKLAGVGGGFAASSPSATATGHSPHSGETAPASREGTAGSIITGTLDRPSAKDDCTESSGARGSNVAANSPAGGSDNDLTRQRQSGRQLGDVPAGEAVTSEGDALQLLPPADEKARMSAGGEATT